ncbi:MAG: peptidylprolyl isomerase, partial [Treponema sp.]|nr:peptidylprolyl isomerase [Treponema sp.]
KVSADKRLAPKRLAPKRLVPKLGVIGMGGYDNNIAGGEFFFPLDYVPRLDGNYPMFGKVLAGVQEIVRIGSGPVKAFAYSTSDKQLHKPVNRDVIVSVNVETFGETYPPPVRLNAALPEHWLMNDYSERI